MERRDNEDLPASTSTDANFRAAVTLKDIFCRAGRSGLPSIRNAFRMVVHLPVRC